MATGKAKGSARRAKEGRARGTQSKPRARGTKGGDCGARTAVVPPPARAAPPRHGGPAPTDGGRDSAGLGALGGKQALSGSPYPRLLVWIITNWKILKVGIPDHLTCLLRSLYAGQEATVRIGHGTTHWFQIGKGVRQGCMLSPCLFNLYAEYIMRNAGLEEAHTGIKILGEISIISDMQMTPPLWQKVKNLRASR